MKRVLHACLEQTIHFQLKEDMGHYAAVNDVKTEYENYKKQLDKKGTKYKITEETIQPDGSIMIRIKKQHNNYSLGDYLES